MTSFRLILASLRFYWRTHLGVLLGVIVATAVLVGAMVVGDSVRQSLRDMALARLGETRLALVPHERYFRTDLAERISKSGNAVAPLLLLPGTVTNQKNNERINRVQVLGMDERMWTMMFGAGRRDILLQPPFKAPAEGEAIISTDVAKRLGVSMHNEILLRVSKPSLLPRDAPLTRTDSSDISLALRVKVAMIYDNSPGSQPNPTTFNLQASQSAPLNICVNLQWLQQQLKLPAQANVLLIGGEGAGDEKQAAEANAWIRSNWQLSDVNVELRHVKEQGVYELRSSRIFLDEPLAAAALQAGKAQNVTVLGTLTYLINEFDAGARKVPYSIGTSIGVLHDAKQPDLARPAPTVTWRDLIPSAISPAAPAPTAKPASGAITLTDWLASDLRVNPGDTIRLKYFTVGPSRELVEQTSEPLTVASIVPIEGAAADRTFLPDFPDMPDENTTFSQWKPGFKMTRPIRKIDDEYWAKHRGTPKAFVSLDAGQQMWANRFGNLTSIRFVDSPDSPIDKDKLEAAIRAKLDPGTLGLMFVPVREDALKASAEGFDFAQLFLGFSFFLIVAALLLTGLLFVFAIEQRAAEVGTLLAVGLTPRRVRRILLGEGLLLAMIGATVGVALGLGYTALLLKGLTTIWRDAVSTSSLAFHVKPLTLILGWSSSVAVALFTIWLVLRKQARTPARDLLSGNVTFSPTTPAHACGLAGSTSFLKASLRTRIPCILGLLLLISAITLLALTGIGRGAANAGAFFGAGSMLLLAGLTLNFALLTRLASLSQIPNLQSSITLPSLALRNAARRRGRSLVTIGLLASGSFLVIAIGAFWLDSSENAQDRKSGTGGFAFYGESTLPVLADLNTDEGLDKFALERADLPGVSVVPMRVRDGDDASCLNLNRAQNPRLIGLNVHQIASTQAFTFAALLVDDRANPWGKLGGMKGDRDQGIVAAIGDANTITYGLGLSIGDTLDYADESGQPFKVKIVATLSNSILQGSLFIDEEQFKQRFPSVSGHRAFLIDAPWDKIPETKKKLEAALSDVGLELTPTVDRLAAFNAVQNTYLGIFQALGGLGLLLGSIGLGVVVLRNVLERRSELALLAAVGFSRHKLRELVMREHWLLLALGLLIGVIAAIIAVLPAVLSPGSHVPYLLLASILAGVVLSGFAWTWFAARVALRGPLLTALRDE